MARSPLAAVLFDAGGTLVTLDYPFIAAVARRRGLDVADAALPHADARARFAIDASGAGGSDAGRRPGYFASLLRAAGAAGELLEALVEDLERAHRQANLWRLPFADAGDTLRALRARGLRTAVVSNADGRIQASMEQLGLAEHLDVILDSHCEGVEKPAPEIFQRALARLGVEASQALYVGDIYSIDAVGARGAGLAPVIIDPTDSYGALDCAKIARLIELLELLDGGTAS